MPLFRIVDSPRITLNIKCSAGFYAAVGKPVLSSISDGYSLTVQGIVLTVTAESTDTKDNSGLVVNRLLRMFLKTATNPTCNLQCG